MTPISSDATNAPASEPMPPTTTTTKITEPDGRRHRRLGDEGAAADHAGQAGERRAGAEHQHEDARHVVAERLDHLGVRQRALDHQADARARQQQPAARPASPARPAS